jgi:hypothetical protein
VYPAKKRAGAVGTIQIQVAVFNDSGQRCTVVGGLCSGNRRGGTEHNEARSNN